MSTSAAAGQMIDAGGDGSPTVIEPPAETSLNYIFELHGTTGGPVWVLKP